MNTYCYWETASGFGHDFDEIIDNNFGEGHQVVRIGPNDLRFTSSASCGTWVRTAD